MVVYDGMWQQGVGDGKRISGHGLCRRSSALQGGRFRDPELHGAGFCKRQHRSVAATTPSNPRATITAWYFNGGPVINHNASGQLYLTGEPGIAASILGGPQVRMLSFLSGQIGTVYSTPPTRLNGQPTGTLASGTTQATLSLATNENATCRFSKQAGAVLCVDPEHLLDHKGDVAFDDPVWL